MRTRLIALSAMAVVALFLTVPAYAQLNKTDGDCPPTALFHPCGDVNVLFSHNPAVHQGPILMAPTNSAHGLPVFEVEFSTTGGNVSPTPDDIFAKGGQSDIDPCAAATCKGDFINNITISVPAPGNFFRDLIIDPQELSTGAVGHLTVTVTGIIGGSAVVDTEPNPAGFSNGSASGQHFLTIEVGPTDEMQSVTITAPPGQGFGDFKQPRISEIAGVSLVPEPSSMMLMGSGMLLFAQVLRRKLWH